MRAISVVVAALLALPAAAAAPLRVFVTPVFASDAETAKTLTRSVETALRDALPDAEIVTPQALDTAIEMGTARECLAGEDAGGDAPSSCLAELADAIDVDVIARPHLGKLGGELVLTLAILDGKRAVVVAQGQRRAPVEQPARLLDDMPGLAREVAREAKLLEVGARSSGPRAIPVVPLAVAGGGVVVAGGGALLLAVRGAISGPYENAELTRDEAATYEAIDAPFLVGGIGAAVVGGAAALAGVGFAAWTFTSGE